MQHVIRPSKPWLEPGTPVKRYWGGGPRPTDVLLQEQCVAYRLPRACPVAMLSWSFQKKSLVFELLSDESNSDSRNSICYVCKLLCTNLCKLWVVVVHQPFKLTNLNSTNDCLIINQWLPQSVSLFCSKITLFDQNSIFLFLFQTFRNDSTLCCNLGSWPLFWPYARFIHI